MARQSLAIVGGGLAGASAAAALREAGFDGPVRLIGAEPQPPYDRPPLSKAYLRGEVRFEDQLVNPVRFYAEHDIELRLGARVTAIEPRLKTVQLDGGERIPYDRLLVATGGGNPPPPRRGGGLHGGVPLPHPGG